MVTLFQVRYYSGEELRTVYGMAHKHLTISQNFAAFDSNGVWRKRMEKELNTGSSKRIVEFFNGPKAYEEKILLVFGMRSDKALTLFNQIVGVKVLNDLDSFIRDNMLEAREAEEKYKELRENFQNLMDAKTSIEKTKEQIRQLEPRQIGRRRAVDREEHQGAAKREIHCLLLVCRKDCKALSGASGKM